MADPIKLVNQAWPGLLAQIEQAAADGVPATDLVGICVDAAVTAGCAGLERWGATPGENFSAMMGHRKARALLGDLGLSHLGDARISRPFVLALTCPEPDALDAHYRVIEMPASRTLNRKTAN